MSVLEWAVKVFTQFVPSVENLVELNRSNLKGKVKAEIVGLWVKLEIDG